MSTFIETARQKGDTVYKGKFCEQDGTYDRYTATGKCVECERYLAHIKAGLIVGIDGRKGQHTTQPHEWTDAERHEHGRKISAGWDAAKERAFSSRGKRILKTPVSA